MQTLLDLISQGFEAKFAQNASHNLPQPVGKLIGDAFEAGIRFFFVLWRFGEGLMNVLEDWGGILNRFRQGLGLAPLVCERTCYGYFL